jgi:hypothetical protein
LDEYEKGMQKSFFFYFSSCKKWLAVPDVEAFGEQRLLATSCPPARMYQCGCHWTNYREIRFWGLRENVEKFRNLAKFGQK